MYHRTKRNVVPWYTTVSKKIVSVSDILAVNFMVGWCKITCSKKATMSGLLMSNSEKMSSIKRFQTVGLKTVLLKLCVSLYAMKMISEWWKGNCCYLCAHRGTLGLYWQCFPFNCSTAKKFFLTRINLSISRTETRNVRFFHLFFSIKFIKSVVSLRVWLLRFWYSL